LKALGPQILHKSERGGVRLDVVGPDDARSAYEDMAARLGPAMSGALVQPIAPKGIETIAGFVQDPQMGPVVLFGLGGTAVELLNDHCVRLAPVAVAEAREMALSIRGAPLLTGYRGGPSADLGQLAEVMVRLSWLAEELPEIAEADCNPVIAGPNGAIVVDARLRVAAVDAARADDRRRLR